MHKFGCNILMFNGIVLILIGIFSVLLNNTKMFSVVNWIMDPNFWGNEVQSHGTLKFKVFTWDYLGMFHIIWGVNIFYIVKYNLMTKKEAWAWKSIAISVATWLFVDLIFTFTNRRNTFLFASILSIFIFFIIPLYLTKNALVSKTTSTE